MRWVLGNLEQFWGSLRVRYIFYPMPQGLNPDKFINEKPKNLDFETRSARNTTS